MRINAVVVLADGGDDGSSITLDRLARETEAACNAEGLAIPVVTVAYSAEADRRALRRIAGGCQGKALTAPPYDVVEVFEGIGLLSYQAESSAWYAARSRCSSSRLGKKRKMSAPPRSTARMPAR
jgi:hypothetical protein